MAGNVFAADHGGGEGAGDAESKVSPTLKKDAASITGGNFAGDPLYLNMPPVIVPVINRFGAQQIVAMIVNLQIKDRPAADMMQASMPKIRDVIFQALYMGLADGSLLEGQALNLPAIKKVVLRAVNDLYDGQTYALDALIQDLSQRKL